jgi:hypothetical protein
MTLTNRFVVGWCDFDKAGGEHALAAYRAASVGNQSRFIIVGLTNGPRHLLENARNWTDRLRGVSGGDEAVLV